MPRRPVMGGAAVPGGRTPAPPVAPGLGAARPAGRWGQPAGAGASPRLRLGCQTIYDPLQVIACSPPPARDGRVPTSTAWRAAGHPTARPVGTGARGCWKVPDRR